MIIRKLKDIIKTENHKQTEAWDSARLLLAKDGMGFGSTLQPCTRTPKPKSSTSITWNARFAFPAKPKS